MAAFNYSDLPLGHNEVRLVSLEALAGRDTQAKWNVEVASLDDESTTYCALSYRWGAPALEGRFQVMTDKPVSPVQLNGRMYRITENLSNFLDEVQKDEELTKKKFWIDAVCINQNDADERSYQVSNMMADIYRSATGVIAWLGEADEYTEQAFNHLRQLAGSRTQMQPNDRNVPANGCAWESTAKLFERTYWNRSWIIQELVLSKQVTVRCGKYSTEWTILSEASHNISTGIWRTFFAERARESRLAKPGAREVRTSHRNYGIPTIIKATRTTMAKEHWTNILLHTLIRSRDFEATNLEDKVYALMGLIKDSVKVEDMPLLCPHFGQDRSAARTYLKTAIQLIRECEELLILSCVEGRNFQRVKIGVNHLPSWVPDWSDPSPLGLRVTGLKRYFADACFIPYEEGLSREQKLARWPTAVNEQDLTVSIRGFKIDEISLYGETKHDIEERKPFPRLLDMLLSLPAQYRTTNENRLEALWRTLIANTGSNAQIPPPKFPLLGSGFAMWLRKTIDTVEISPTNTENWANILERFNNYCREDQDWNNLEAANHSAPEPGSFRSARDEYGSLFSHGKHLRPFLTEKGYMGLGSESLQEGDTVWVVPRSRVPLILRQVKNTDSPADYHCELVGGAFLHGFMDGQALLRAAERDGVHLNDALERIVIH